MEPATRPARTLPQKGIPVTASGSVRARPHQPVAAPLRRVPVQGRSMARVQRMLDACADIVPGIVKFEVALAQPGLEAPYDVVLYSEFTSSTALDAYQEHPQHLALKPFIGAIREARQCMDYEV